MRADQSYIAGGKQMIQQKVEEELAKYRIEMKKEIEAHRDTHTDEQEEKEKKILEMGNQLALVEK